MAVVAVDGPSIVATGAGTSITATGDASAVEASGAGASVVVTITTGVGGVTVHNELTGRDTADAHPISAVTGLQAALDAAGSVDSVNTQTGVVVLDAADVGADVAGAAAAAQAAAVQRANHTGTQAISTVTNLQTDLDGKARAWSVDHIGVFGPGFDNLVSFGIEPWASLTWGDDYYAFQKPSGEFVSVQAAEGDTILNVGYLNGDFTEDHTKERIWTLTSGVWVMDADQPTVGEIITGGDTSLGFFMEGVQFFVTPGGRTEVTNLQYIRNIMGRSSVVERVAVTGEDGSTLSGAVLGTSIIDATAGAVVRTTYSADQSGIGGKEFTWVKVDASANTVTIDPDGTDTINGSTDPIVLTSQWDQVTMVADGVSNWAVTSQTVTAADIPVTPPPGTGNLTVAVDDLQTLVDEVDDLTLGGTVDVVSNVAADRILGRVTAGSGDSEELTATQVRTLLGQGWTTISKQVLGVDTAEISVNTTGYDFFRITFHGRSTRNATVAASLIRFNGDSSNVYSTNAAALATALRPGSVSGSATNTDRTAMVVAHVGGASGNFKSGFATTVNIGSTATVGAAPIHVGLFSNLTAAITSIQISTLSGDIAAGTLVQVEGA